MVLGAMERGQQTPFIADPQAIVSNVGERPATESLKQIRESKILNFVSANATTKTVVFADGNRGWQSECGALGLQHRHVVHQLKQFTGEVETARGASKIAGTQCVDRLWQSLKRFLPPKLAAKDPKTKTISRAFGHMIYSFAWRKSLGPRTGPQFLEELSRIW